LGYFSCDHCNSLTSLEGAPERVGMDFDCNNCKLLKTLEGAPKECNDFKCSWCESLTSLKGAPEKVGGFFNCMGCKSLRTLEGAPKEVGDDFSCNDCGVQFTEDDVRKHTNAKKIRAYEIFKRIR
jgi:hypothetical protein